MKRCVDCMHCWWPEFATGNASAVHLLAQCQHPKAWVLESPVLGNSDALALFMREAIDTGSALVDHLAEKCGPDAIWFEPHGREPGV